MQNAVRHACIIVIKLENVNVKDAVSVKLQRIMLKNNEKRESEISASIR